MDRMAVSKCYGMECLIGETAAHSDTKTLKLKNEGEIKNHEKESGQTG